MFVADTVIGMADGIERNLAVLLREGNQFAAGVLLRSSAFVGVDVSLVTAQDRLEGAGQSLQAENVRSGTIEGEENCNVPSEMLLKLLHRRTGVGIVSVGNDMAAIGAGNGLEDFRMHTSVVVTGKAAGRRERSLLHSATG